MKLTLLIILMVLAVGISAQEVVKDSDGNSYKIVKTGDQVWMAENLKTTHYSNGEMIPNIKEPEKWSALSSGASSELNNSSVNTQTTGFLYNWYAAADKRNVCPSGWHVPSESEWATLISFLSGEKEPDPFKTSLKVTPKAVEINQILFSAMPEGFRSYEGDFMTIGNGGGGWWSSTSAGDETAYFHGINYNTVSKKRLETRKTFGYSIRCIKD